MDEILMCCVTTNVCSIKRANITLTAILKIKLSRTFLFCLDVVNDAQM